MLTKLASSMTKETAHSGLVIGRGSTNLAEMVSIAAFRIVTSSSLEQHATHCGPGQVGCPPELCFAVRIPANSPKAAPLLPKIA
eukprot:CAMPEP_0115340964 /NCGR_PEP_ID=MMETSP0270-20121206/91426_1 /TAXON_ID=71861 /ORGANISM="Scrippsiella trochoidea, Strain CCMP3099" /LENGTH=83 /DNA_ID=CAMNT_0002762451 /DNA_START=1 /DNA_END=248 /DNA_ORIENTATION=+